jgi:hypothetical protein
MVYVDNMQAPFGNMIMCHMIADTTEELIAMAKKIGVAERWIQDKGTYSEHFDICLTKRKKAVAEGAKEITMMELGRMLGRRAATGFYTRKTGLEDFVMEAAPIKEQDWNDIKPNPAQISFDFTDIPKV